MPVLLLNKLGGYGMGIMVMVLWFRSVFFDISRYCFLAYCHLYGHFHHLWTFALTLSSEKSMLTTKSRDGRASYDGYVSTLKHAFATYDFWRMNSREQKVANVWHDLDSSTFASRVKSRQVLLEAR